VLFVQFIRSCSVRIIRIIRLGIGDFNEFYNGYGPTVVYLDVNYSIYFKIF